MRLELIQAGAAGSKAKGKERAVAERPRPISVEPATLIGQAMLSPTGLAHSGKMPTPGLSLTIPGDGSTSQPPSPITILPATEPVSRGGASSPILVSTTILKPDTHAEALTRLIYVFCRTNPQWAYSPTFVDVIVPLYLVYLEATSRPTDPTLRPRHAEEDAYWAFSALMGEFGDIVSATPGKDDMLNMAMAKVGRRVRWADEPVWRVLCERNLDPGTPLYTFQWMTTLLAHDRRHLLPIWDYMFAQPPAVPDFHPKLDLLVDLCVAMICLAKKQIIYPPHERSPKKKGLWDDENQPTMMSEAEDPDAAFVRCLQLFRNYPLEEVGGVYLLLNMAFELNQARRIAVADGENPDDPNRTAAADGSGSSVWASAKLKQAAASAAQGATASTGRLWSQAYESDAAASIAKAKSNFTASYIAASAKWNAAPAPDWKSMAGRWLKGRTKGDDEGSVSGEEFEHFTSLPSTPGRSPRNTINGVLTGSPGRHAHHQSVNGAIGGARNRSDSLASTSNLSVTSLQDRLSGLALTLGHGAPPAQAPGEPRKNTGPRPLLLSSSARRASNSSTGSRRDRDRVTRSPSPISPPDGHTHLYRIGSRNPPRSPRRYVVDVHGRSPNGSDSEFTRRDSVNSTVSSTPCDSDGSPIAGPFGSGSGLGVSPLKFSPYGNANGTSNGNNTSSSTGADATPTIPQSVLDDAKAMEVSIPTPQIGHLTEADYEHVYEPAEDSFILLDALEADAGALRAARPALALEIGSGSGIASTFVATMFPAGDVCVLSTDINAHAADATRRTAAANGVHLNPILANLVDPLQQRVAGKVDLMLFNPPYVETENDEMTATQAGRDIGGAWAGGSFGMQVTNLVLERIPMLLAPGGRFYLVAIHQNKPDEIIARMRGVGLECKVSLRARRAASGGPRTASPSELRRARVSASSSGPQFASRKPCAQMLKGAKATGSEFKLTSRL